MIKLSFPDNRISENTLRSNDCIYAPILYSIQIGRWSEIWSLRHFLYAEDLDRSEWPAATEVETWMAFLYCSKSSSR